MNYQKSCNTNSQAEDLFVQLFCEAFGPEKAENLYVQYPFIDIYGNQRFIDFALENQEMKIAIEIDGETYHNPKIVSENKYYDDLLKQNSMVYQDWKIFRWAYYQLLKQPSKVKDELVTYLGETSVFKEFQNYLPVQQGESFELRDYQEEAISNLREMRKDGKTIALLYHATGVGKTLTAATDAKNVGGRTLFLVNALKLAEQAEKTFISVWPEATRGYYTGYRKDTAEKVIFATVQSVYRGLLDFSPTTFDYIVVDECHHAAAKTYQKIFGYFRPKFILGLSATPERLDGENMLELFQNVAHKMDLQAAIERGILTPIRCIRVKTNIDLSDVRINGIKYNSQDLESKLFIPERNQLIVNTFLTYVKNRKTVIFCASVNHAIEIARLLSENGIRAEAVSGQSKLDDRNKILSDYENGDISVLCACDLLTEGWDSPKTEVLFMARPTMSRTIYFQQLGRGTRKCEGKIDLLVFDFVDNANMFNRSCSLHRLLKFGEYHPLEYVLAPIESKQHDKNLFFRGEKPTIYLDIPINADDFELIDLYDWQSDVEKMISQTALVRMIDVQQTTINTYISNGRIVPDIEIPISATKSFKYFKQETVNDFVKKFKWDFITSDNIKDKFIEYINSMDMVFSYKPILFKSLFTKYTKDGKVRVQDIVDYYIGFYECRRATEQVVENPKSLFASEVYSKIDVEKLIFRYPFRVFSEMDFGWRCKDIEWVEINKSIISKLTSEDIKWILDTCDKKIVEYYERLEKGKVN